MNRAFFTKLYVDGRKARVIDHELREPFDVFAGTYKLYQDQAGTSSYHRSTTVQTQDSAAHEDVSGAAGEREELISSLASVLAGQFLVRV